jgi:hypothetical protein
LAENKLLELKNEISSALKYKNIFLQTIDIFHHKIRINTSPIDYYRYKFYKSGKSWDEKCRYIGKRCSNYYPYQSNAVQYVSLFDNKYVFSNMLSGFKLPHPKLLATIGKNYELKTFTQFSQFISMTKCDMVLKPLDGSGGEGVIVLLFDGDRHRTLEGECSLDAVWDKIHLGGSEPHSYLIEERVEQHESLSVLYPHSLNTLRVITVKTNDSTWNLMAVYMRIGNNSQVDNLGVGGIQLTVNLDGYTTFAYDWLSKKQITQHPITNELIVGIKVPFFQDAVKIALKASKKFSFMGTIGFDIGISKSGPMIIEGNIFYDCVYWQKFDQPPMVPEHLASKLPRRRWWQRWDKTAIHPKVNRWRIRG